MALSINYPSPFGGEAFTYFIIGQVHENRYRGHATVVSYGFLNADARQAMANYVPISTPIDATHWVKDASIAQIYTMLKATPQFANATDV
jgi:hypothetical protein